MMRNVVVAVLLLSVLSLAGASAAPPVRWPSMNEQLRTDRVVPDSALQRLIEDNQDFAVLRAEEAKDKIPVPLWLRVWWRKAHPELTYSRLDPTGGYPLVLKEIHEWMTTHQDLVPGITEPDIAPGHARSIFDEATTGGTNIRISGAQTAGRSESDIRVNYWNPTKIIAGSNNIGGSGQQAQYYSTDTGATWGQTTLPLPDRRRLPLRPDGGLDLRRHRLVDHHRHQLDRHPAQDARPTCPPTTAPPGPSTPPSRAPRRAPTSR